ncbi:MAG TPA: ABC transporter substrate-binding protein, partial [Cyanobacteria bacterium UBA11148]|nr:ABC transporter substrate-binding protein [Cyanobacteria bacterium UBA11148]
YGLGIVPELPRQYFMIKAFDGDLANEKGYATFASPNSLKGLQDVINQYRKDRSSVVPSDVGASSASEMLGQGRVGMVIEGNWAIPYLQETFPSIEFATTEIPSINGKPGTMAYTVAYVMNKQAKHKNEAWELISYLTGKEGMKAWSKGGVVLPTRNSVLAELGYDNSPLYVPFIRGAEYATLWQVQETLPIIVTHFNNQFLSALIGEQILQVAMNKAQRLANEEIQEANY